MNLTTPFRYDYVGSFLRPEELKQARADHEAGHIDDAALKAMEDAAITELIAKQKAAGYHVITDGEFRRSTWHLDFMWGFEGVGHKATERGLQFQGEAAKIDDTFLTGKISLKEHPFVEHFKFVKQFEDENTVAKQTIPAPSASSRIPPAAKAPASPRAILNSAHSSFSVHPKTYKRPLYAVIVAVLLGVCQSSKPPKKLPSLCQRRQLRFVFQAFYALSSACSN